MAFLDDLTTLMEDASVGVLGESVFINTHQAVPILASGLATLQIVQTSGSGIERTQNSVIRPGYVRPSAQFMARADTPDAARAMADAAYDAVVGIRNTWIVASREYVAGAGLQSGWYREINPLQEPFDPGTDDDRRQAECGFNIIAIKRP